MTFPFPTSVVVDATGRYVVDQVGQPLHMKIDSAWNLSTRASDSDLNAYFANRQARGYNGVQIMLMVNTYWATYAGASGTEPNNVNGDPPFNTAGDFSTPNAA